MRVVRVSGTIKKAEEEAIRRAKEAILKARRKDGQTGTDGLIGLLGEEEKEKPIDAKGGMSAEMDLDEDDEMAMDSDEDG